MSAKWVRKIQLVSSFYNGYWQTRGWSSDGTVQTVAFVILPGDGAQQSLSQNNGSVLLGGYAYAGDRGISKVEVRYRWRKYLATGTSETSYRQQYLGSVGVRLATFRIGCVHSIRKGH